MECLFSYRNGVSVEPRSYLYVPADRPELIAKAHASEADVVIVDLEDAVAPSAKHSARADLVKRLADGTDQVWVRINSGDAGQRDLDALAAEPNVLGFCLTKASLAWVESVACTLDAAGSSASLAPLVEDAAAVYDARALAAAPRVVHLHVGEADLKAELGMQPGPDEAELLAVRTQIVLACAAAGAAAPIGSASTNYRDLDALRASTERLARLGFYGRTCIHPAQLAVVNAVFTPTPDEIARAEAVLAALDRARGGIGADGSGEMLDEAVARAARRVLARARRQPG